MTIVTINDKYRINIDTFNHTLEEFSEGGEVVTFGKHKGSLTLPQWTVVGYYPNISQSLRRARELMLLTLPDCTIDDYLRELARLNEEVV